MMETDEPPQAHWVMAAVNRYAGPLTRYALFIIGDIELARDIVQETFLKLCSESPGRVDSHLAQWLFTVCRNHALDVQRKEYRIQPLNEVELGSHVSPTPSPAAVAEQRETTGEILELIAKLPKNQQEVIRLKFQNGMSYQEISAITNLTVGNVGFLIHTALKAIRSSCVQSRQPIP